MSQYHMGQFLLVAWTDGILPSGSLIYLVSLFSSPTCLSPTHPLAPHPVDCHPTLPWMLCMVVTFFPLFFISLIPNSILEYITGKPTPPTIHISPTHSQCQWQPPDMTPPLMLPLHCLPPIIQSTSGMADLVNCCPTCQCTWQTELCV